MDSLGPIPEGVNAVLVERRDAPGRLGVAVRNGHFVCPLPEGYDGYTNVSYEEGWVLVTHPKLPPLLADPSSGRTRPMDPALLPKDLVRHALMSGSPSYATGR